MSDQVDRIVVACPCGAKLRVKAESVGRKVRCPKCDETFRVEDPNAVSTEDDGAGEGDFGMMEELAAQADLAPPAVPAQPMTTCPNCMGKMPADSRMCMACGYDVNTGKVRKVATAKSAERAAKVKRLAGGAGRLVMGTALSGVGALIGAGIWTTVALLANVEIGYIAVGVGFLAGYGMRLGRGNGSVKGGVIAAGMGLAGILIAKMVVFGVLVYGAVTGDTNDLETQRTYVARCMVEEALDEREIWSEAERNDEGQQEWDRAVAAVEHLGEDAVRKRWREYRNAAQESERSEKIRELAEHHSLARADAAGLYRGSDRRAEFFTEEESRFEAMTPEQIEVELADLRTWREESRFSDPQYVRDFLIYEQVDEPVAKWHEENEAPTSEDTQIDEEDDPEMPEHVWDGFYAEAAAEVDAMTPEARLAEVRKITADRDREYEALVARLESEAGASESEGAGFGDLFSFFFAFSFGFLDLLFIAFALSTAYKVALGGDD